MALVQRHTTYIRCQPAALWAALTDGSETAKYFYAAQVESSFEPSAEIRFLIEDDEDPERRIVAITGEVIAAEAERSLVYTFHFCDLEEPSTTVRWTLTPHTDVAVRVEIVNEGFDAANESWRRAEQGWPIILAGLKTWLETGEALALT